MRAIAFLLLLATPALADDTAAYLGFDEGLQIAVRWKAGPRTLALVSRWKNDVHAFQHGKHIGCQVFGAGLIGCEVIFDHKGAARPPRASLLGGAVAHPLDFGHGAPASVAADENGFVITVSRDVGTMLFFWMDAPERAQVSCEPDSGMAGKLVADCSFRVDKNGAVSAVR
jgi:hypothetical protein